MPEIPYPHFIARCRNHPWFEGDTRGTHDRALADAEDHGYAQPTCRNATYVQGFSSDPLAED